MKNSSKSPVSDLRSKLEALNPDRRKELLQKLNEGNSFEIGPSGSPIRKAKRLRTVAQTDTDGREATVGIYPASHTQERMWFLQEFDRTSVAYNTGVAFRFNGLVRAGLLEKALQAVVDRHESLRTTFLLDDTGVYQQVHSALPVTLKRHRLHLEPGDTREGGAKDFIREVVERPFDLEKGPLIQAHLGEISKREYILVILLHHIISDGWSRAILCRELGEAYAALLEKEELPASDLPLQFVDYAAWQAEQFQKTEFQESLQYWKRQLAGKIEPVRLPIDSPRPAILSTSTGETRTWELDPGLMDGLKALALGEGATLYMVLLAAYNALLHQYSGQTDVVVGGATANRTRREIEGLIGCFINSLAIRSDLSGNPTFRELLSRVKHTCLEAFKRQSVPYEQILAELNFVRDPGHTPVFQTMFAVQDFEAASLKLGDLDGEALPVSTGTSKLELSLLVEPGRGEWRTRFEYNTALFSRDRIDRIAGHWNDLLRQIVSNPSTRLADFSILKDDEKNGFIALANPADAGRAVSLNGGAPTCYVIGDGRMPIEVVELLRDRGWRVLGVSTTDPFIMNWCRENEVNVAGPEVDIRSFLSSQSFDYLFSVVNPRILSSEILGLPEKMAINFHDAPLPRFAGVNAPAWGIINREKRYGVTWHEMVPEIDAGDILKQVPVDILESDTFPSMGLKCVEAGVGALDELLSDLQTNTITRQPQDLGRRTYFNRYKRPSPACILLWNKPAEDLYAIHRALDFGPLYNPIGTTKLLLEGGFVVAGKMRVIEEDCGESPGTLLHQDEDAIKVATSTFPVELSSFCSLDGQKLTVEEVISLAGIRTGESFPIPGEEQSAHLTEVSNAMIRQDGFWRRKLAELRPVRLSGKTGSNNRSMRRRANFVRCELPAPLVDLPDCEKFLVAAWSAFIARVSGEEIFDLEYCDETSGSAGGVAEALISRYVPLRIELDAGTPFADALQTVQEQLALLEKHACFARDLVVRNPVCHNQEFLHQLHKLPLGFRCVGQLPGEESFELGGMECVLLFGVEERALCLAFVEEVASRETFRRYADSFSLFLSELCKDSRQVINQVRLLQPGAVKPVLDLGRGKVTAYPKDKCIHHFFEMQAKTRPDAIAVEFQEERLTYRRLNASANQLARRLLDNPGDPGRIIGLCLDRSPEMIIGILGILKAGAAYLPLDPDYPRDRIQFMVADANVDGIVTNRANASHFSDDPAKRILMEDLDEVEEHLAFPDPEVPVDPQELAYIIYTSGSTGEPKGVQIEHRSLVNYTLAANRYYEVTGDDRILQLASLNFDASAEEIYCALTTGATLVLRTREMLRTPADFTQCVEDWKISVLPLPTAYWHTWMAAVEADSLAVPESVRLVVLGGEQAANEAFEQWQRCVGPSVRLVNGYGPTETTICATWCDLTRLSLSEQVLQRLPIGKPVDNLETYVLDPQGNLLPPGIPGELFIGGDGQARGYLNREDLNTHAFVEVDLGSAGMKRLYRSGDKVTWNEQGDLVYLGRMDQQVKIRGFRIEMGEIEARLAGFNGIRQAVVSVFDNGNGDQQLAAYLVAPDAEISISELRTWLKEKLPAYMVPLSYTFLDEIPLTPSGKVDRPALPDPVFDRSQLDQPIQSAGSTVEIKLARMWADILKMEEVGVGDNFFELGGHSLLASQVIARIRKDLKVEVLLRDFFEAPTVAGLAKLIANLDPVTTEPQTVVEKFMDAERWPLSFAQQRLWFLDRLKGSSAEYNIPKTVLLRGNLNRDALKRAINSMVERHDSLRTCFGEKDGIAYQLVVPELHIELPCEDLRGLPQVERDKILAETARTPFDLENVPLLRASLFRIGEDEHLFQFNMHHIVSDGWSFGVVNRELSLFYNAFARNEPLHLDPLPLQYPEYAVRQQERLQGEYLRERLDFWKENLKDPPTLDLPVDHPRPPRQTYRGGRVLFSFDSALSGQLKAFNQTEAATPFMTFLAAFEVLLSRYSGQQDMLIGTPFANRLHVNEEPMIGFFINTLVMRGRLSDGVHFRGLVKQVRDNALDAYQNHEVPFEKLVEELNPKRDPSRHPLFQVMFALQNAPTVDTELTGLEITDYRVKGSTTHFDLSLGIWEKDGLWQGAFSYNADLFEAASIQRLSEHFGSLLASLLGSPETPVASLPMLSRGEEEQLIGAWGECVEDYPAGQTIHGLFEGQVKKTPEKTAVVFEDQSLSYLELNEQANHVAEHLKSLGVEPDVLVGVCLERSLEMLIAMLAIMKAGGAYLPLDPHFPADRLKMTLDDANAPLLITQKSLKDRFEKFEGTCCLVEDWTRSSRARDVSGAADSRSAAYVIYTSGSTGKPKGTVIEHASAVNMLNTLRFRPGLCESDVFLTIATVSFDISVFEMFGPLCVGARLVIMPDYMRADGREIRDLFEREGCNVIHATPSMWKILMYAGWQGGPRVKALTGGEALEADLAEQLLSTAGEVWNMYGPTETTVYSLIYRIEDPDTVTIGRPVGNTRIYIVDKRNKLVPVGVPGELLIGGVGLAREYLNRPGLTAERFVPDPFRGDLHDRVYRTGDLCRWRPNGTVEYLGRMDNQVKIRGYRIELGEIEYCAARHPLVRECATRVWEDGETTRIAAYLVPEEKGVLPEQHELLEHFRRQLPEYMVPSCFEYLENLPKTPNSKLDRKALPKPDSFSLGQATEKIPPSTHLEKQLARIWSEVLEVEDPGIKDNFFDVGGHSLLAFQVVSRIRGLIGEELYLKDFFDNPTISDFIGFLERTGLVSDARQWRGNQEVAGLEADPVEEVNTGTGREESLVLPASYAQYRLWFLEQLERNQAAYHMPFARRLHGGLDIEALRKTLETIVSRHEPYRTVFTVQDGDPMQVIQPAGRFDIPVVDLSHLEGKARDEEVERRVNAEAAKPFDLSHDLMIRASLLYLGKEDHVLMITEHHIASDGWSHRILWNEIKTIYEAYLKGEPCPLPKLLLNYRDVAHQQRQRLQGAYWNKLLQFWKSELAGISPLELPADRPRPVKLSSKGASKFIRLDERLVVKLRQLAKSKDMTLLMTLLTGFQVLLSRLSGQKDIVVGMPSANRRSLEEEKIIGLFINTILLRGNLEDDPAFNDFLTRVKSKVLDALDHQDMPFEMLVEELQPERDLSRNPLFQVLVNMQEDLSGGPVDIPGLTQSRVTRDTVQTKFDLTLYIGVSDKQAYLSMVYSTDLFDGERIATMLEQLAAILQQAANRPELPVSAYSLVTRGVKFPGLQVPLPRQAQPSVIRQILDQARRQPAHAAIRQNGTTLSYENLRLRILELAAHLKAEGLAPGDRVMVQGEKDAGTMVALLGALAAGGVMVPVDPEVAEERFARILALSEARWFIHSTSPAHALGRWSKGGTMRSISISAKDGKLGEIPGEPLPEDQVYDPDAESPAYIFFTSGTTGKPKGILGRYEGLNHFIAWQKATFPLEPGDRVAQLTPLTFDVSLRDIFLPLSSGATLCLPQPGIHVLSPDTLQWLRQERVGALHTVPSILDAWLQQIAGKLELPDLRFTFSAGEPLQSKLVLAWKNVGVRSEIINLYGPTETTLAKCFHRVPDSPGEGVQPIGEALPGAEVFVCDRKLRLLGVGETGELVVRTPYASLGYLEKDNGSAGGFLPNPYCKEGDELLYRTGDLGRWRPDGVLEILGRLDDQVKIGGVRIQPKSVEACLNRHSEVETCRVLPFDDDQGNPALAAYLVAPGKPSLEDLRQFALRTLPSAVIPSAFVFLERIPLTKNGKLDREALPKPEVTRDSLKKEFIPPETEQEQLVASIFEELLNVQQVGRKDNFFTLGGNSLRTVQLCSRIAARTGKQLPIATVFEHPEVAALARTLQEEPSERNLVIKMADGDGEDALFCLPGITRNPLSLSRLVDRLDFEGTCYGIELPDCRNGVEPFKNMDELADFCARQIQDTRPRGPYHLAGYSFGGLLAFATACKLLDKGLKVASVVILDTHHRKPKGQFSVSRLSWALKKWLKDPLYYPRYLIRESVFAAGSKFGLFKNSRRFVLVEIFNKGIRSLRSTPYHFDYEPVPRPLPMLVFTARNTEFSYTSGNELALWQSYSTEPVKYVRVGVDHHNQLLLDEHLEFICREMKAFCQAGKSTG